MANCNFKMQNILEKRRITVELKKVKLKIFNFLPKIVATCKIY